MDNVIRFLADPKVDEITKREIRHFVLLKDDEQAKIKGQIARDLSRIGANAYAQSAAYTKLRAKYRAANAARKKLLILENMRKEWCTQ